MTRAALRLTLCLTLLLPSACATGAKESSFARPRGELIDLDLGRGHSGDAELLAVRPEGLVLRTNAIVVARWEDIRSASFERLRGMEWPEWTRPGPATIEKLRLVSRFPQGLDEDLTRRLLDAYGQERVRPCRVEGERLDCGGA